MDFYLTLIYSIGTGIVLFGFLFLSLIWSNVFKGLISREELKNIIKNRKNG